MHNNWIFQAILIFILLNTIVALVTVFHRRRSIISTLAWLLVLTLLPGIGFIIFGFFGRGIAHENMFTIGHEEHVGLDRLKNLVRKYKAKKRPKDPNESTDYAAHQIRFFNNSEDAPLAVHNETQIFTDGKAKFRALFKDCENAKETINIEYYSFINDRLGNKFVNLLTKKTKQGVTIHVLYDRWGSAGADKKFFKPLTDAGGEVMPFITSQNAVTRYRLNYHLHRKIVVIDGNIGWTGGFNVGDQYVGESKKFGYWRDTHVRIHGYAVLSLQERFVLDWNASSAKHYSKIEFSDKYFPTKIEDVTNITPIQIVSDGPQSDHDTLKGGFISFILNAKKSVKIQTPYLIPDDSMIDALLVAARSGLKIDIMIPCMPDHPFIYRATQYYANLLTQNGINIYIYNNGFLHAKTAIFDNKVGAIGSMNQDYRSYDLNFEADAFIYDKRVAQQMTDIYSHDIQKSTLLTQDIIDKQSYWLRFKQLFSRLLSPIL